MTVSQPVVPPVAQPLRLLLDNFAAGSRAHVCLQADMTEISFVGQRQMLRIRRQVAVSQGTALRLLFETPDVLLQLVDSAPCCFITSRAEAEQLLEDPAAEIERWPVAPDSIPTLPGPGQEVGKAVFFDACRAAVRQKQPGQLLGQQLPQGLCFFWSKVPARFIQQFWLCSWEQADAEGKTYQYCAVTGALDNQTTATLFERQDQKDEQP